MQYPGILNNSFLLVVLLINSFLFSQEQEQLTRALEKAQSDTARIRIMTSRAQLTLNNGDKTYALEVEQYTRKKLQEGMTDDTLRFRLMKSLMFCLDGMAFLEQQEGNGSKAITLWEEVLEINKDVRDELITGYTLLNIGYVNDRKGNVPKALEYYHNALSILEKKQDMNGIGAVLNNLASIYNTQGDVDKALEFYRKSLDLQEKGKNKLGAAYAMENIAGIYRTKGKVEEAHELWQKCLAIHTELKNKVGIANIYVNLADYEKNKGNTKIALDYFEKALKLREEVKDKLGIERSLSQMSRVYFVMRNYAVAKDLSEKALSVARELGYPMEIQNVSYGLSLIYSNLGDYKKAYEMHVLFKQMSDSVNKENTRRLALKKNFEYAFQKQAAQDSVKAEEAKKVFDAEIRHQKTQSTALYVGIGLIAVFSIFMYNRFRITRKQKAIIEEQKHLVEEKQKEIIESMHYAKRIQTALMPSEKTIQKKINTLK